VNRTQHSRGSPWWEKELFSIRQEQSTYLRRRLPAFRPDHDDLLNDTLLTLTKHIRGHASSLPESWFKFSEPPEPDRQHLHKLASKILSRRIADFYRQRVHVKSVYSIDDYRQRLVDSKAPSSDRKLLVEQMLKVTALLLDELRPKDRDLLALISDDPDFRAALSTSERKRLQRIRIRLRQKIARHLGAEAADLLRISF
jgi:DNA-directed RNA polymerase specialized sigma24 family protein